MLEVLGRFSVCSYCGDCTGLCDCFLAGMATEKFRAVSRNGRAEGLEGWFL